MKSYDVAIIGLGAIGSLAAAELARRKASVIGFDEFAPPHDHGSHSGDTRIFRVIYAENPGYVPLAQRAEILWEAMGEEWGDLLLHRCGLLSMGKEDSNFLRGIRASAQQHRLEIESFSAAEIRKRYPALNPPEDFVGLLESDAGWVEVNPAIQNALQRARELGAELNLGDPVIKWKAEGAQFRVSSRNKDITARYMIVAAGVWSRKILSELKLPLVIRRKVLAWFQPRRPQDFMPEVLPIFVLSPNIFYGLPNIRSQGLKVGEHLGGLSVEDPHSVAPPDESDLRPLIEAVARYLPTLATSVEELRKRLTQAKTCLYTLTPDEHFIIDWHPQHEQLLLATGFSGHGFKFAPVVAEVLADLLLQGRTNQPINFLRIQNRFRIT